MEIEKKNLDNGAEVNGIRENNKGLKNEKHKWVASLEYILEYILKNEESEQAAFRVEELIERLRESGLKIPYAVNTPYINTIPPEKEPPYPGNREIERRIKSYVRWNAMAMVVKANRLHPDIGGHISTYASSATLYEVGLNHFFRGGDGNRLADMVYFQGHASPGRLLAGLHRMAHQRPQAASFSPRIVSGGWIILLSASVSDSGLLAVPHRVHGTRSDHVDISGPLQSLSQEPRPSQCRRTQGLVFRR